MANTYTSLTYHIVFSTKDRHPWIVPKIEASIWAYLGGIAAQNHLHPIQIGGIEDHVHILLGAPPTSGPSKIAQTLKGASSTWIHQTFLDLRAFTWQDGYGAFTVSRSDRDEVARYIAEQRKHHRTMTFQEEFLRLLQKHEIDYDEKYLWG